MSLLISDQSVYPMQISVIKSEDKTLYDRSTRGKSWFFLRLYSIYQPLETIDGNLFMTVDNNLFHVSEG